MRRLIVLVLLLLLCGIANAVQPCIVRDDLFQVTDYDGALYVFVPADNTGTYWTRYTYNRASSSIDETYTIRDAFFGKVYPCKRQIIQAAGDDMTPAADTGTWSDKTTVYSNWTAKEGPKDATCTFDIPETHNRVHVYMLVSAVVPSSRLVGFYYDGDEVDETQIGTNLSLLTLSQTYYSSQQKLVEWVATTDLPTNLTNKKFIIKNNSTAAGSIYIKGIRSFDDDSPSTAPATEDGAGVWMGYDLLTTFNFDLNYRMFADHTAISGYSEELLYANTVEFTVFWKPDAESTAKITASGAHYDSAGFIHTTDAELYVDNVDIGTVNDDTEIVHRSVYSGDSIEFRGVGYGDYDAGSDYDAATEPVITYYTEFTQNWTRCRSEWAWGGDSDLATGQVYVANLCLADDVSGYVYGGSSNTRYVMGDSTTFELADNSAYFISNSNWYAYAAANGPVSSYKRDPTYTTNKVNTVYDETSFTAPASGITTILEGFFVFKTKPSGGQSVFRQGSSSRGLNRF